MVFNSYAYVLFLPTVLGLYWLLRERNRQNALLLAASYLFYGAWDYRFLGLMWISTLTDFTVGKLLSSTQDERRRKAIFLASLAVNLGILGFFKYFDFFTHSFSTFLERFGMHADLPTLGLILPIGISFYTFHGISYTFDVYRRHIEPTNNLLDFACFVAFFPQLVAGPIGRAHIQLPQFENPRRPPDRDQVRSALFLILLGLFKKIAIADALAPFVDRTFASAATSGAVTLVAGAFAFTLQLFGDFSGYSDVARGSSRLFGIELLKNFDQPYLARNITEFWHRWHISLSSWLRDYLYIPLGGNRGKRLATYRNIMLTMLLGGLWHGSRWTFVIWGGLHGAFLSIHRMFSGSRAARGRAAQGEPLPEATLDESTGAAKRFLMRRDALPALFVVSLYAFTLIFFRSRSFTQASRFLGGIVRLRAGAVDWDGIAILVMAAIAVFAIEIWQRNSGSETPVLAWRPVARGVAYLTLLIPIIVLSGATPVQFIYFQF